jgi:hypothetical protein
MSEPIDVQLIEAGVTYRDRQKNPDPRRENPRYAVEIDRGFQAPVILGEGASPAEAFERAKVKWLEQPKPRAPSYAELETTAQTWQHIDLLRKLLRIAAVELLKRGETHDRSKFDRAEVDTFTEFTPKLKTCTYGSDEYKAHLVEMKVALDHHYGHNRHHPEHFARSIHGMNLVDVFEMLLDWWGSSHRHADGDIRRSIEINRKRFGMSDELVEIFLNTVQYFEPAVAEAMGGTRP